MERHGALVGWTHQPVGEKLMVSVQSMPTGEAADRDEPDVLRLWMTRNQAAVLGNYLVKISGHRVPALEKRTWLARLFG